MSTRHVSSLSILLPISIAVLLLAGCAAAAAPTAAPAATSVPPTDTFVAPTTIPLTVVVAADTAAAPVATDTAAAPAGLDGATLLATRCSVCHSANRVVGLQGTADQWQGLVDQMINQGAQLTPQEEQVLVAYLAATYHP